MMEPITINEYLDSKNPWTKRLLGLDHFQKNRNIQQIENEYNLDKYAKLLGTDFKNIEQVKEMECEQAGLHPINGQAVISFGDAIFKTTVSNARNIYYGIMKSTISKYNSTNICELGCSYGYNLTLFNNKTYGGEYSANAVQIGRKLGMNIQEFNYYNSEDYDFLKPDTTIFTSHSVEQMPDAAVIIENLAKHKDKINYVVHFEPTIVKERNSLLGMLRNKYIELNDYNRNLIDVLKNRNDITILELKTDLFGLVPLNTSNLIVWKFKN